MYLQNINFKTFFINIIIFIKKFTPIITGLLLILITNFYSKDIDYTYNNFKFSTNHILNENFGLGLHESQRDVINRLFLATNLEAGTSDITNPDFQMILWQKIRTNEVSSGTKILQSIILGFLYWYAYMATIRKVRDKYMPIDTKSFLTFSLTSGGMVLVNGFIPGSIVYAESFILAGYAVFLHSKNKLDGNEYITK
ncbi:MAG: hypothetical protein PHG82_02145 [Candidatus Gracilibacteria bacterium]|nr:hypothetical protein [Candidatus Gracilibacteria bacterium]